MSSSSQAPDPLNNNPKVKTTPDLKGRKNEDTKEKTEAEKPHSSHTKKKRVHTNSIATNTPTLPDSGGDTSQLQPLPPPPAPPAPPEQRHERFSNDTHDEDDDPEEDHPRSTATYRRRRRRVRAKSALPTLFAIVDTAYLIVRVTLFVIYDSSVVVNGEDDPEFRKALNDHYCNDVYLAQQISWTSLISWGFYLISTLFLMVSICRLSLKICYASIIFKTASVIIYFVDITYFGLNCLSRNFYFELGIFFVIHLPVQAFEASMLRPYVRQMKRGSSDVISVMPTTVRFVDSTGGSVPPPRNLKYTIGSSETVRSPTGSNHERNKRQAGRRSRYFTVD